MSIATIRLGAFGEVHVATIGERLWLRSGSPPLVVLRQIADTGRIVVQMPDGPEATFSRECLIRVEAQEEEP